MEIHVPAQVDSTVIGERIVTDTMSNVEEHVNQSSLQELVSLHMLLVVVIFW